MFCLRSVNLLVDSVDRMQYEVMNTVYLHNTSEQDRGLAVQGANYTKVLRLSYDVIITYDNRKSNLR